VHDFVVKVIPANEYALDDSDDDVDDISGLPNVIGDSDSGISIQSTDCRRIDFCLLPFPIRYVENHRMYHAFNPPPKKNPADSQFTRTHN
jgi:hypothetical protein